MHYHLIGICGTAMASLAGMLQARGHRVTGSDQNVYPPMSTMLADLVPMTDDHGDLVEDKHLLHVRSQRRRSRTPSARTQDATDASAGFG